MPINKKLGMFLFANNRDTFIIFKNKLIGNIIERNTKFIYVFQLKKKQDKNIYNFKVCIIYWYINLNYTNRT